MNYYFDTEFLEGTQKKRLLGIPYGETVPTIDLISIGVVAEDDREYYAVSKDFNLKEAWNRFQVEKTGEDQSGAITEKVYWIRNNVLYPIWKDLVKEYMKTSFHNDENCFFTYGALKRLIKMYGKTNKEISEQIESLTKGVKFEESPSGRFVLGSDNVSNPAVGDFIWDEPVFYAYYADYDWVVFCWLFGKMTTLPKGFPMYCRDLKQDFDDATERLSVKKDIPFIDLKKHNHYPVNNNAHNALDDARWNHKLHQFLNSL